MKTLTLSDGSNLPVPVARNEGVEMLYADNRVARLPISRGLDAQQFTLCAIDAANQLPTDTHPGTIVRSIFNAACVGVLLGKHPGHAFLVAYRNSKANRRECQFMMGYRGYIELAYDSRFLESVCTDIVLRGEEFRTYIKDVPHIEHELPIERELEWKNVVASYCIWTPRGGQPRYEVVGRAELAKLKKRGNVWDTNPIAQCRKTPIRRAAKLWKQSRELAWAVGLDDAAERGDPQGLVRPELEGGEEEVPAPSLDADWSQSLTTDDPALEEYVTALKACEMGTAVTATFTAWAGRTIASAHKEMRRLAEARKQEIRANKDPTDD